jgi:hypothetical protein
MAIKGGAGVYLYPRFFGFPLLIIIPELLHIHLLASSEMFNNPDQAAHYHFFLNGGFIAVPALIWL